MTSRPIDMASAVIALCAVLLTGVALWRRVRPGSDAAEPCRRISLEGRALAGGRIVGSPQAPVRLTVFYDYQCPYCAAADRELRSLLRRRGADLHLELRHYPLLEMHDRAWGAAQAVECAAAQGRFERYHALLFDLQDSIGRISWRELARRSRVPRLREFEQCVAEERFSSRVDRDLVDATRMGIRGTPAILIGDEVCEGTPDLAGLDRRITRELADAGRH